MPDREPHVTLEAVSEEGTLLRERRKSFGPEGGTIGRSPQTDWVLSDDYVSRQHARVSYADGQFFIEDTNSKSGVWLNGRKVGNGNPSPITSGDRLRIEPYEIAVRIGASVSAPASTHVFGGGHPNAGRAPATAEDPLKTHYPAPPPEARPTQQPPAKASHDLDHWNEVEPLLENLLNESVRIPASKRPQALSSFQDEFDRSRILDPPTVQIDVRKPQPVEPPIAASPAAPPAPAPSPTPMGPTDLDRLFASAGLDAARVPPEVAEQLGQIIRTVVEGVLDVLAARQRARDAFRIQSTMFRPRGNNPLKFSTDVEDALHNLFVKRGVGYLGPLDAFEEAFNDLRHHQSAVVTAMQKAFETVLQTFQAESLQRRFDQTSKGGKRMGLLQGTPNYWALYGEWVSGLLKDPNASFRDMFGEAFSEAYEDQLKRLRAELKPADAPPKRS